MNTTQLLESIEVASEGQRCRMKDRKPLSISKVIGSLEKEKDWDAIAYKCSQNPRHEMYGKEVKDIRAEWMSRATRGANRGNSLDDLLTYTYTNGVRQTDLSLYDETTIKKYDRFMLFYQSFKDSFNYVGSEIWLNSSILNIRGRLDALFTYVNKTDNKEYLLIFDWKNTEKIAKNNRWEKLIGPMSNFDNCEWVRYTLQTYLYRYILEDYGFDVGATRVIQLLTDQVVAHKPAFQYDRKLIQEIVQFAHKNRTR